MSAPMLRANTELVAKGWLAGVPGLGASLVATQLPKDKATWASTGFVQFSVLTGALNTHDQLRSPVLDVNCWAVAPTSNKAPWGLANNLAEHIVVACYDHRACCRVVVLPGDYPAARVLQAEPMSEPMRIYSDDGAFARYQFELRINWAELP